MTILKLINYTQKDLYPLRAGPFKKNKKGLASVILATNSPNTELVITILIENPLFVNKKMHFFSFFLQPLPDCHHFLLFGGFLFRLWCSFHSRLVVTAAGRVCFLSVSCCRACGVGRLPRRCPLSTRGRFAPRVR